MCSIDINVNSIFYKSFSIDKESGRPVYVFDSSYLPSFDVINDKEVYDLLIEGLMDKVLTKLPSEPFILIVFSSGFTTNNISWVYGIKLYSKVPKAVRSLIEKTIIVHESFFVKTVFQVLKNAMRIKELHSKDSTNDTVLHVPTLSALATHLDITLIRISLNVYLYDYQFNPRIELPQQYVVSSDSLANKQYRQLIFDRIFRRLKIQGPRSELVFQKPGSYKKISILLDVIERNHYVDLSQWDIYSLGSVFLNFLKNKSKPLIPLDYIPLPVHDELQYTASTFSQIIQYNGYYDLLRAIFPLFIEFLNNSEQSKHTPKTLSRALAPTLCKEKVSMKSTDQLAIGTRFIRNLLLQFYSIIDSHDSKDAPALPPRIVSGRSNTPPELPRPRKSSPIRYTLASPSPPPSASSEKSSLSRSRSSSVKYMPQSSADTTDENSKKLSHVEIGSLTDLSANALLQPPPSYTITSTNSSSTSLEINNSPKKSYTLSPSKVLGKDIITDAETNEPKEVVDLSRLLDQLTVQKNAKIQTLDKELRKKKRIQQHSSNGTKFSSKGYSEFAKGSKVSKLAALYEERLQGLQAINDLK